jgi:hypothetical protein
LKIQLQKKEQKTIASVEPTQHEGKSRVAHGYHQILTFDEDVPKTMFRTPFGHYQFEASSLRTHGCDYRNFRKPFEIRKIWSI